MSHTVHLPVHLIMEYGAVNIINYSDIKNVLTGRAIAVISGNGHTRSVSEHVTNKISSETVRVKTYYCTDNSNTNINLLQNVIGNDASEVVIGVGGGKVMDAAKIVGTRLHLPVILIPTIISTDAICSPVAAIRINQIKRKSTKVNMPWGVVIDLGLLEASPPRFLSSGIGELLSTKTALLDWQLAHQRKNEQISLPAKIIAENAVECVLNQLKQPNPDRKALLKTVTESLIISGIAMCVAGNSRPCSGAEHLISHALDYYCGAKALHGEQVAVCSLVIEYLHGQLDQVQSVRQYFRPFGLPVHFTQMGYSRDDMRLAIQKAPSIRNRYTILNEYDLSDKQVDNILDCVFPE